MLQTLKEWDRELLVWLNSIGIENWDNFWLFITHIESWFALFIYFFILIFHFYGFKKGCIVLFGLFATVAITIAFTDFAKDFVARLRPNNVEALGDFIRVLQKPTNYSFFSGHASSSFAITTYIVLSLQKYHKYVYLFYLWPLLFVLSRIYVGVHYPSDIFVGTLVGTSIAVGVFGLIRKVKYLS
jgi:undecaprenyl-diphosphatase